MLGAIRTREPRPCSTRDPACCRAPRRPGVLELPAAVLRGPPGPRAGQLRPDPAPAPGPGDGGSYIVSLGEPELIDAGAVLRTSSTSTRSTRRSPWPPRAACPSSATPGIAFAGAYHGWGFHEDGARTGVRAAARLGRDWDGPPAGTGVDASSRRSSCHDRGHLPHEHPPRAAGAAGNAFTTAATAGSWTSTTCPAAVVAAAARRVPRHGPPRRPRRPASGQTWTASSPPTDVEPDGGKVTMLANARVLGQVFNPHEPVLVPRRRRRPARVIAEVHNTYGERHCYLLRTDDAGRARDRQGVLCLAVQRRGRQLPDEAA